MVSQALQSSLVRTATEGRNCRGFVAVNSSQKFKVEVAANMEFKLNNSVPYQLSFGSNGCPKQTFSSETSIYVTTMPSTVAGRRANAGKG